MKMQNGGVVWKNSFLKDGIANEFLYNGAVIEPILNHSGYETFEDILKECIDIDDINGNSEFLKLNRLPILSNMDGHSTLCFDYGYEQENEYKSPQICLFEFDFSQKKIIEKARFNSYDEMINSMVYFGYESTAFYYGINTQMTIEDLSKTLSINCGFKVTKENSTRYGWFNFENWIMGEKKINEELIIHVVLSPNESKGNTFLFSNNEDSNFILEIEIRKGVETFIFNSNDIRIIIEESISELIELNNLHPILIPYNVTNINETIKTPNNT